jgi:hypothetical protein
LESILGSVAVYSAVVATYLAARGVPVLRIAKIFRWGAIGGAGLGLTLGLFYAVVGRFRPLETFAFLFMVALTFAAAALARERILGSIGPLAIIFLNIAIYFAPDTRDGPKLLWLEMLYWNVGGVWRTILEVVLAWLPALGALLFLVRRGGGLLAFLLGLWACWIAIVTLPGPAWSALTEFRPNDWVQWLWLLAAVYAAVHVGLLALNFLFAIGDAHAASALASSVRVEQRSVVAVLLWAAGFWVAMELIHRLTLPAPEKTAYAVALALLLDWLLAPKAAPAAGPPAEESGAAWDYPPLFKWDFQGVGVAAMLTASAAYGAVWAWNRQLPQQDRWASFEDFDAGAEFGLLVCTSFLIMMVAGFASYVLRQWRGPTGLPIIPAAVLIFVVARVSVTPIPLAWERDIAWRNPGVDRLATAQVPCWLVWTAGGGIVQCGGDSASLEEARPPAGPRLAWPEGEQRYYRVEYSGALPIAWVDSKQRRSPEPRRRAILCIETRLQAGTEVLPAIVLLPLAFDERAKKSANAQVLYDDEIGCGNLMQASRSQKFVHRFRHARPEFVRPLPYTEREKAGLAFI